MCNFKMPIREQNSNKGTFGKVLNFCGSGNFIGAAYLSTVSSLKVGAGYSALASTKEVITSVSSILPEIVYLSRKEGLTQIKNFDVVLIGCGLGTNRLSQKLMKDVLHKIPKELPLVIDADGLNILAQFQLKSENNFVITPHPKEASRLLDCSLEVVLNDLVGAAKKLTQKYNCVTVLKTHRTVICDKDFKIYINEHGNSALAKAGSGDVLAGMIAGLLAQGMECYEASKLGVYLHSVAGEIASEELTEYSVLASDLIDYIPEAIKTIL